GVGGRPARGRAGWGGRQARHDRQRRRAAHPLRDPSRGTHRTAAQSLRHACKDLSVARWYRCRHERAPSPRRPGARSEPPRRSFRAAVERRTRWAGRERATGMTPALESRLRDLGEFIRDQRRNARLSLRKLSELAGISNPYLSQIERGLRKPSAEILQAIARALRISSETLYVRAGILEERDADADLVEDIMRDRTLTEGQKQALVEIYRSFQRERVDEGETSNADSG